MYALKLKMDHLVRVSNLVEKFLGENFVQPDLFDLTIKMEYFKHLVTKGLGDTFHPSLHKHRGLQKLCKLPFTFVVLFTQSLRKYF